MSKCITKIEQSLIATRWQDRAASLGLKKGTKRYKDAQFHFVAGAASALHATDPEAGPQDLSNRVPVAWVIAGLSGRDPFDL
jgi:hypothetical protein